MRDAEKDDIDEYVTPYRITCLYYEGQTDYYPEEKGLTQEQFQANRFDSGEVFYLGNFDKETYAKYGKDIESKQTLNGFAFYFNTEKDLLKDANVRKALSAALDRKAITEATATGEVPATGYVPNGVFNTDRKSDFREVGGELYSVTADKAKAESFLGNKKGTVKLVYLVPQNAFTVKTYSKKVTYTNIYEEAAKKAAENWAAIGIKANLVGLNPTDYLTALKTGDFDVIGVNILNGSVDAFSYLAPFAKEFSGSGVVVDNSVATTEETFAPHYTKIDNADYSKLIQSALVEKDRAKRAELLHDAEKKLVDELCPATMVFFYSRNYVESKKIGGIDTDSWFGYIDLEDLKLDDWREVNAKEESINEERNANKK
jgi:ABC-type oligopeptide transport system substrate-binding subunit